MPDLTSIPSTPEAIAVLDLIATASDAHTELDELLKAGATRETIDELVAAHWLEHWTYYDPREQRRVTAYTLTPRAEPFCWLQIIEDGVCEKPRWGRCEIPVKIAEAGGLPPVQLPHWDRLRSWADTEPIQPGFDALPAYMRWEDIEDESPSHEGECEADEELERYDRQLVTVEARDETGRLQPDPKTGKVMQTPIKLLDQFITIDRRLGKGNRKKRKGKRGKRG